MLSQSLSEPTSISGVIKSVLPLVIEATDYDFLGTRHGNCEGSSRLRSKLIELLCISWDSSMSCIVKDVDAISENICLCLFSLNLFYLPCPSFSGNFRSTPAKQPKRPDSLCVCKDILFTSILILSRVSTWAIRNKLSIFTWTFLYTVG